jgi:hypothetical protein
MPHARKRFGQHFLVDPAVIERIVAAIDPRPGEALVEIGPGRGALTSPLLARAGSLTAIELDRDLAARLKRTPGLEVVEADVLGVDFAALAAGVPQRKLRVVGNLPYNISTPILFHLLEASRRCGPALHAAEGGRRAHGRGARRQDYGRLTVMLQWRYEIERCSTCPEAFEAPPRVVGGRADDAVAEPRRRSGALRELVTSRSRSAAQAAAPHARPLARAARRRTVVRRPASRRRSSGGRIRRPRRRAPKSEPSLRERGSAAGEGTALIAGKAVDRG